MQISWKSIGFIPIQSKTSVRMNPNQVFIRTYQNQSQSFRPRIHSNWTFGLDQSELGLSRTVKSVRIHSDWSYGLNWNKLDWFLNDLCQKRFKKFFGLVRNGLEYNSYNSLGLNTNTKLSPGLLWLSSWCISLLSAL